MVKQVPYHKTEDLRGNVITRLSKLENSWGGVIFALAGLERINILQNHIVWIGWFLLQLKAPC